MFEDFFKKKNENKIITSTINIVIINQMLQKMLLNCIQFAVLIRVNRHTQGQTLKVFCEKDKVHKMPE